MKIENSYKPLVSVIINSHNGKNYLKNSIESVLNQSYQNFEIIFFDNNSNDNSKEEIFKIKSNKIKYFYSSKFIKLYKARSLAVYLCEGEILAFLDVDDWWDERKLELQVKLFKDDKIGFSCTNFIIKDEINNSSKLAFKKLPSGEVTNALLEKNFIGMCTLMVRKSEYFSLERGFNHKFEIIGDYDLTLRLSLITRLESLNYNLSFYRWHNKNLSNKKFDQNISELRFWYDENNIYFKKFKNLKYFHDFVKFYELKSMIKKKIKIISLFKKLFSINLFFFVKFLLIKINH